MKDIIESRVQFLLKSRDNPNLQSVEKALCKRDILHFFRNWLYTDKNSTLFSEEYPNILPFIPFEFQEELILEVWNSIVTGTKPIHTRDDYTNVFIEKSRQMWVSWIIMGIFVYWWLFHDMKFLVISQKETDVDKIGDMKSLFEKARFMIAQLPMWMLPVWFSKATATEYNKYMSISRSDWTWSITGESANPNASRWGTYHAIFMDEMAFMSNASTINTAAASATPCRIFNSTPNGEGNEFYRMKLLTEARQDDEGKRLEPEIKRLRYHWTEHPIYCQYKWDVRWYNLKKQGMTKERIAQELDINYNSAIEWRVYWSFKWQTENVEYDPTKPLYVWIDNSQWGTDPHAVCIAQTDPKNHYIDVIDAIQMNASIVEMANFMAWVPKMELNNTEMRFLERYRDYNWKMATFVSDPYDTNTKIKNIHSPQGIVIKDEYRKVWIHLNTPKKIDVKTRIMNTQSNIYRLRVNPRCADFISSIQNARYPTVGENTSRTTPSNLPIHDWTSHYRTAMEYWFAWILENEGKPKTNINTQVMVTRDKITWKLIYMNK